jgi:hypothetical protein
LVDQSVSSLMLVEPATLSTVLTLPLAGTARDAVFMDGSKTLAAVSSTGDGRGELKHWRLKAKKGELLVKKELAAPLEHEPARIGASPGEDRVAVAYDGALIEVFELEKLERVQVFELTDSPRDMVWCDPSIPGPLMPEWTSDEEPALRMDP